jgi:hypothetical protein
MCQCVLVCASQSRFKTTLVNFINVKRANFLYEFFDKAKT